MQPLDIEIENIEPIHGVKKLGPVEAGVNVLRGCNGTGKSTIIKLATLATSNTRIKPGDIPIVAGAARGRFRFSGRTLIVEADRTKRSGETSIEVGGLPPEIKDLDDPGLKGSSRQAEARLRALCQACRLEPNDSANLWALVGPHPWVTAATAPDPLPTGEEDEYKEPEPSEWPGDLLPAVQAVIRDLERKPADSLPAAAKRIKLAIQEQRRLKEDDLQRATEHAKVLADRVEQARQRLEGEARDELAEATDVEAPALRWSAAKSRQAFTELKARQEAEAGVAAERRVREQELLDAAGIDQELAEAEAVHKDQHGQMVTTREGVAAFEEGVRQAEEAVRKAEAALSWSREKLDRAKAAAERAKIEADQAFRRFERLAEKKAELDRVRVRLAKAAESTVDELAIDVAEAEADKAERLVAYRVELEKIATQEAEAETARQAQDALAETVAAIDEIDGAVWSRLGDLLSEKIGEDRLRVVEGVVEAKHEKAGWCDLESSAWSEGQRWHLVLGVMVDGMQAGDVVGIEGDCPIDDPALEVLGQRAVAKDCALLLEKEEDCELRMVRMGGKR